MLYLIEMKMPYSRVRGFKVGTTTDVKKRMRAYKTHNPYVELIDKKSGGESLERKYHVSMCDCEQYFRQISERKNTEWFEVEDKNIIKILEEEGFEGLTELLRNNCYAGAKLF